VLWLEAELDSAVELVPDGEVRTALALVLGRLKALSKCMTPRPGASSTGSVDSTSRGSLVNGSVHSAVNSAKA
jgi:hypothetical protein